MHDENEGRTLGGDGPDSNILLLCYMLPPNVERVVGLVSGAKYASAMVPATKSWGNGMRETIRERQVLYFPDFGHMFRR